MVIILHLNATLKPITFINFLAEPFVFHLGVEDDILFTSSSPICLFGLSFKLSLGHAIASREHFLECSGDLRGFVYQVIILNLLDATILDKRLIFRVDDRRCWLMVMMLPLGHSVKLAVRRNHDWEFLLLLRVVLVIELPVECVHLSEFATFPPALFLVVFA